MSKVKPINATQKNLIQPTPQFNMFAEPTSALQNRYSVDVLNKNMMGWENSPATGATPQFLTPTAPVGNFDPSGNFTGPAGKPKLGGDWTKGAAMGLGAAEVGLGVWNALEQQKMNKFMRGYYGDQMNLQRADFGNNAKSTNAALEQRERNRLSAAGHSFDSAENKQGTADAMAKWGVKETF